MVAGFLFRQNGADLSSEEFDSESSVLLSKRPTTGPGKPGARRSRSYSRSRGRGRGGCSDSSASVTGGKRTTFVTEAGREAGERTQGGSIKSTSSYDVSKISFQGKRALFEAGKGTAANVGGRGGPGRARNEPPAKFSQSQRRPFLGSLLVESAC